MRAKKVNITELDLHWVSGFPGCGLLIHGRQCVAYLRPYYLLFCLSFSGGGLVINLQRYQWQILRAKMDHLFNEFIKNSIIINEKRRRIQTTSSKGENLDVTEHRWRALQECDTSYILSCVDLVGFFLPVKPQEFKNVDKQTLGRHILRRQRIQLCLVIYMAVSSPTAPRITRNCGSAHELESPEVQNWVTLLTLCG